MAMYRKVAGKAKPVGKKQAEELVKQARLNRQSGSATLNQKEEENEDGKSGSREDQPK